MRNQEDMGKVHELFFKTSQSKTTLKLMITIFMIAVASLCLFSFDKGLEFGGGYSIITSDPTPIDDIVSTFHIKSESYGESYVSTFKASMPNSTLESYKEILGDSLLSVEHISPSYGHEMLLDTLYAGAVVLIGIFLYVALKYNSAMAVSTLVALIHDVVVTLFFALALGLELNILLLGALVTVVGYSVNDTVVTLEQIKSKVFLGTSDPIRTAIITVLPRSIVTSQSTLLVLFALVGVTYGDGVLFDFALMLMVGVISGTLSSLVLVPFALGKMRSSLSLVDKPSLDGDV